MKTQVIKIGPPKVLPLDIESTIGLFCNKEFVDNVRPSKKKIAVKGTGGSMKVDHKATHPIQAKEECVRRIPIPNP